MFRAVDRGQMYRAGLEAAAELRNARIFVTVPFHGIEFHDQLRRTDQTGVLVDRIVDPFAKSDHSVGQILGLVDDDLRMSLLRVQFPKPVGNNPHPGRLTMMDGHIQIHHPAYVLGHFLDLVLVADRNLEGVDRIRFDKFVRGESFAAPGFPDNHFRYTAFLRILKCRDHLHELGSLDRSPIGCHDGHSDTVCHGDKIAVGNGRHLVVRRLVLVDSVHHGAHIRRTNLAQPGESRLRQSLVGHITLCGRYNLIFRF